jgi:type I restriction enzyme S subunit
VTKGESVPLGEVLRLEREEVLLEPTVSYRTAGIYSFGKGVFEREPIRGADTSYRSLFCLRTDQFIVSRLNGWEGAVDVVTPSLDGCLVSNEYPTFSVDTSRADPGYLRWIARWPAFWDRLVPRGSMVRRKRVQVSQLLEVEIPLPPIEEQRRVAERLERLSEQAKNIQHGSQGSDVIALSLIPSWLETHFAENGPEIELGDAAEVFRGRSPRYQAGTGFVAINQACVRWGNVDRTKAREVEEAWWLEVSDAGRLRPGDVLVNSTGEGTIGRAAVADALVAGLPYDSHVLVVRCYDQRLLPGYLAAYLRSPPGQAKVEAVKGANTTKQTELGKGKLELLTIPAPSIDEQYATLAEFDRIRLKLSALDILLDQRKHRLAAVQPAALNEAFAGLI